MSDAMQLVKIVDLLTDLYSPEEAARWLRTPLPALGNRRAVELLNSEDGQTTIIAVLTELVADRFTTQSARV
jgi:uncharacterized protein (DUF2384 family)